jgi:hypothetical protein
MIGRRCTAHDGQVPELAPPKAAYDCIRFSITAAPVASSLTFGRAHIGDVSPP